MRAFTLVFCLFVLQTSQIGAVWAKLNRQYRDRASTTVSRATTENPALYPADVIALRQHIEPRALLDVCAYIDTAAILHGDLLGIPLDDLLDLKICLCLSALPLILDLDVQLKVLTDKYGHSLINAVIELLIDLAPNHKQCQYPANSERGCSAEDPCSFTCNSPYVKQGNQCVCPPPYTTCNGKCGDFSKGCSSAVPRTLVGRSNGYPSRRLTGQAAAQATCKSSETVCGVLNSADTAYDCVDTNRDLESCGGCMVPSPFVKDNKTAPVGRDCTAIEGAATVSCISGSCFVRDCEEGWTLSETGDACVQDRTPASLAFNIMSHVMDRSRHVSRSPEIPDEAVSKPRPEPKVGDKGDDGTQRDWYENAWYH